MHVELKIETGEKKRSLYLTRIQWQTEIQKSLYKELDLVVWMTISLLIIWKRCCRLISSCCSPVYSYSTFMPIFQSKNMRLIGNPGVYIQVLPAIWISVWIYLKKKLINWRFFLFILPEVNPVDGSGGISKREIAEAHGPPVSFFPEDFADPNHGGYHWEISNIGAKFLINQICLTCFFFNMMNC